MCVALGIFFCAEEMASELSRCKRFMGWGYAYIGYLQRKEGKKRSTFLSMKRTASSAKWRKTLPAGGCASGGL